MKIRVARSAGFCFGVRRALNIALTAAGSSRPVYMLGDIVHNEEVVRQVRGSGIRKTASLKNGSGKALLIRAHGTSRQTLAKARECGWTIVDATCPMVKEIHRIARRMEQKDYRIIIIGDRRHDEVRGIMGQLKDKALVIEDKRSVPLKQLKNIRKAAVVVQSTQNLKEVLEIVQMLRGCVPALQFYNTICKPTQMKQEEIRRMPLENDVMLVIGSRTSANTKRLFEISMSLNKRTYWITDACQIKKSWFRKAESVGITAGASTPDSTTAKAIEFLRRIGD